MKHCSRGYSGWVAGFVAHLGNGQVLDAELWGIYCGLRL